MENKNKILVVLVIILGVLVLALGGYIVYDKVLNTNNDVSIDGNDKNTGNDISLDELKNIFENIYDIYTSPNPYCGENKISDKKIKKYTATNIYYRVSLEYSSYEEMINDFKKYATEDVISNGSNARENYLEEDGKLYCEDFQKGSPYSYMDSDIQISEQSDTLIKVNFKVKLTIGVSSIPDDYEYKNYDVVFEKIDNGNYIITSIEQGDSY